MSTTTRLGATLAFALLLTGCANVQLDTTGPTATTVEALRAANLVPAGVGVFQLAPGKDPTLDTALPGLRGSTLAPAKGRWSQLLKDTLVAELSSAGLYNPASAWVIEGQLTDSRVDAAFGTGTGRLAAQFTVKRGGQVVFNKHMAIDATWESSFVGAVAIPEAMNRYGAMYKQLVAQLVADPDFRRALAR